MLETRSRDFSALRGEVRGKPVAIIDIGSNSVRLVVYAALARALTPIFNEKAMCGLGRGVATTGRLPGDGAQKALQALRRYRILCETMRVEDIAVIATAAARDAQNGPAFLAAAGEAAGREACLLSGAREARLSALGVLSAIHSPDGVVGDLGGGSLELVEIANGSVSEGVTLPLGGLALMDVSGRSPRQAARIARKEIEAARPLANLGGRTFYAVGGAWRALARLHMRQCVYPLEVMHNYRIPAGDAAELASLLERPGAEALAEAAGVSAVRRPLLAYGAVVLEEIVKRAKPKDIVVSAAGVREGLLYERLSAAERLADPLLAAAREFEQLLARAPSYGEELIAWTGALFAASRLDETTEETRLRRAACFLSDVAWRAHPDYRASQALAVVANSAFVGIDHPGRAFLSFVAVLRHGGDEGREGVGALRKLVSDRLLERARALSAAMRLAYLLSAAMPGVLPETLWTRHDKKLLLSVPSSLGELVSDRVHNRMKALGRLIGLEAAVAADGRP